MADDQALQLIATEGQSKAREILDRMSEHRIDPRTIKTTETQPRAKGGQGTVTPGMMILPEEVVAWRAEQPLKRFLERRLATRKLESKLAIKKFGWNRENAEASAKFFKSFVNELSIMAKISHPNIVEFIGFVEEAQEGDAWIIVPWEENGNVREFLQSGEWDIPERVSLVQDIINGVEYLHTRQPPICHGDLKSLNILVNSSYHAVITDFGSARIQQNIDATTEDLAPELPHQAAVDGMAQESTSPKIKLNPSNLELTLTGPGFSLRWTAPEVLNNGVQALPSDMWAVGWICWEIFTGKMPFEGLNFQGAIISHVMKGKLPAIREEAELSHILAICGLMTDCWISNPVRRIDASSFRRKVHFVPSTPPFCHCTSGGAKVRSAALLHELGNMYRLQNNVVMAESHYRSAIDVATRTKDNRAKAHALEGLGFLYITQSRYQEAEKALMESHDFHFRLGIEVGVASALAGLGGIYKVQSRVLEAEKVFMEAYQIYSRIGYDLGTANALDGLGEIYRVQSKTSEAEKVLTEAHEIYSRIGNDSGAAGTLRGLGNTYHAQSRIPEAEKALIEAHEIFSRIGNHLGAANTLVGLGNVYRAQSRDPEAEKAFMEARETCSRIGDDIGTANALHGLGNIYRTHSRYLEAEKAFMEMHELHSHANNNRGTASALHGLGNTFRAQSRYSEAEKAFMEEHEIHSRLGKDLASANALVCLGAVYHDQSRNSEAEDVFMEAHEIYTRIGNESGAANSLVCLGDTYRAQSRNPEAEKIFNVAHNIYHGLEDSIGTGNASYGLAILYSAQCRFDDAEASFLQAAASYDSAGDGDKKARTLVALGVYYHTWCRYSEAEEVATEALAIWTSITNEAGQASASVLLSQIFQSQSKPEVCPNGIFHLISDKVDICWPLC